MSAGRVTGRVEKGEKGGGGKGELSIGQRRVRKVRNVEGDEEGKGMKRSERSRGNEHVEGRESER